MQRLDLNMERAIPINNNKKIFVASLDYDGCLAGSKFTEALKQIQPLQTSDPEKYKVEFKAILKTIHQPLIEDILEKAADCDEIILMIGSNRQTITRDRSNANRNKNGSCFVTIPFLAEVLQELAGKPVQADLRMLEDALAGKENGYHAAEYLKNPDGDFTTQLHVDKKLMPLADHKYAMIYMQMLAICQEKPDCEVVFNFYDDLAKIVDEAVAEFRKSKRFIFPANLSAVGMTQYLDVSALLKFDELVQFIQKHKQDEAIDDEVELFLQVSTSILDFVSAWREKMLEDRLQPEQKEKEEDSDESPIEKLIRNNFTKFADSFKTGLIDELANKLQVIENLVQRKQKITFEQLDEAAQLVQQFTELLKINRHSNLKHIFANSEVAVEMGYQAFMDAYQDSVSDMERVMLLDEKPVIASHYVEQMSEKPLKSDIIRLPKKFKSIAQACLFDPSWADSAPELNTFALWLQVHAKTEVYEHLNVDNKQQFLLELGQLLENPACDCAVILSLFDALKRPDGIFAKIHASENPRWDSFRLLFKSSRSLKQEAGNAKFWHTSTYMVAVKALKDAYRRRYKDTTYSPEKRAELADYNRGNSIIQAKQTADRKIIEDARERLGISNFGQRRP